MHENAIATSIVEAALEVHRQLGGPGLLESIYEESLCHELVMRGLKVECQVHTPVFYKGCRLKMPLRVDMKVEDRVLVENKSTTDWNSIFEVQMLTYLRVTRLRLGLVINFGERWVKSGIYRVVNGLTED